MWWRPCAHECSAHEEQCIPFLRCGVGVCSSLLIGVKICWMSLSSPHSASAPTSIQVWAVRTGSWHGLLLEHVQIKSDGQQSWRSWDCSSLQRDNAVRANMVKRWTCSTAYSSCRRKWYRWWKHLHTSAIKIQRRFAALRRVLNNVKKVPPASSISDQKPLNINRYSTSGSTSTYTSITK